ncbi:MAG TPA: hypothetical protein VIM53_01390 [Candidatus Saccharimonadales bacterium]
MNKKQKLVAIVGVVVMCLVALIFSAVYYAHHSNGGAAAGTSAKYLPSAQTPTTTHNTSPASSPCPNDDPPVEVNIGGNAVEACSQPIDGTVTTVSNSSITIRSSDTNASQTFSINSGTHITHHGVALPASGINVGDTVSLISTDSDASVAWYILVNPTFQGQ